MFGLREIIYLNEVAYRLGDRAALAEIRGGSGRALFNAGLPEAHAGVHRGVPYRLSEGGMQNAESNPDDDD